MGQCLAKPHGHAYVPQSSLPGRATITPRQEDSTLITLIDTSQSTHCLVRISVLIKSTGPAAPRAIEAVLQSFGQASELGKALPKAGSSHTQAGLWDEWRLFYTFEQVQQLRLIIFAHAPSISDNGKVQDKAELQEIGLEDFTLAYLLCQEQQAMQMRLQARDVACTVAAELLLGPFTQLQVDLSVAPLQQPDGVPALVLARQNGHLSWTSILTAQAPAGGHTWRVVLPAMLLCGQTGAEVVRWQLLVGETLLGSCQVPLHNMLHHGQQDWPLTPQLRNDTQADDDTNSESEYDVPSSLQVNPVLLRPHPCFLEHVIDGLRLSVMFAIDFTEGNPEYEDRQCMHHELPGQAGSICQAVMTAVADVLCAYCDQDWFTLWGFGGSLSAAGCYPLNGNSFMPKVQGVDGVINTYRRVCSRTKMQGPLQLAPVIQGALQEAQGLSGMQTAGAGLRIMLVILSDDPFDLAQVQEEVKAAQEQPLVILVVGIGTSGFHEMEELASSQPGAADQHVLQFCHFRPDQGLPIEFPSGLLKTLPSRAESLCNQHGFDAQPPPSVHPSSSRSDAYA